jgi:hypothetical protein
MASCGEFIYLSSYLLLCLSPPQPFGRAEIRSFGQARAWKVRHVGGQISLQNWKRRPSLQATLSVTYVLGDRGDSGLGEN